MNDVTVTQPEISTDITVHLHDGRKYLFAPKTDMTGYQAVLVAKLFAVLASNRVGAGWNVDGLFDSVHDQTLEHWETVP